MATVALRMTRNARNPAILGDMSSASLFIDQIFLRHETGRHPENPRRLIRVAARLEQAGLVSQCRMGNFELADEATLLTVHSPEMIARVRSIAELGGGAIDADTILSPESYDVARAAAGAATAAVDDVIAGPSRRALCLVRPPGHHANSTTSMGFCLFNNIAVAAEHARKVHGLERILIVDWDVHHGNGTQDIFYNDGGIHFLSIHRFGRGFYPGTGDNDETGTGAGLGCIRNVPIAHGTSRNDYRAAFEAAATRMADLSRPQLVLVSAGFDAHAADPIGSLGLECEDFEVMTRLLIDIAGVHAEGRLVSLLEGGYHLDALAESVRAHLEELTHYKA